MRVTESNSYIKESLREVRTEEKEKELKVVLDKADRQRITASSSSGKGKKQQNKTINKHLK